ncbi:hypothetical protein B9G53_18550 [Pseudanabaena sp. SR411]|uniref:nSTAND1 domain-containing NTPase n=1 Tax=Pseudanabaena sp. SR411 TaxID=1980935 RepID=UPI000B98F3F0|nr:caspase family protein [Pseudanabaena sp. SR411]OYQ63145.1 hypothetical protein B9G53_18550 [Pseudanabaena sp. SR411]
MARYALVIGISEYSGGQFRNLKNPVTDAEAVAQILEKYGNFHVKRIPSITNEDKKTYKVTRKPLNKNILESELTKFLQEQATKSDALIYFSGHGFAQLDTLNNESEGFLAASDCMLKFNNDKTKVISNENSVSLDRLNKLIGNTNLSSLVVILDCCNSGYFASGELIRRSLKKFNTQSDYYLITASQSYEKAYESEEYSLFTQALLKGLKPENAGSDGKVSGDRLFDFINTELRNSRQEPTRAGWGRSITIVEFASQNRDQSSEPDFKSHNPYRGLAAFEEQQADFFYGRETATRDLIKRITDSTFLAVSGTSGCGKSSLIKAGLLPYLAKDYIPDSSNWVVKSFTPEDSPLRKLAKALEHRPPESQTLLLFIDQFEEVFTLCKDEHDRKEFISQITKEATNPNQSTRVIITIRGDFLQQCAEYPETATLINRNEPTTYFITPHTEIELEKAIAEPARKQGVIFEDGLISEILQDVANQSGALPLLQYALTELWNACIKDNTRSQLTREKYAEIGRVGGALQKSAEELYRDLAPKDKDYVRRLFMELVELSDVDQNTRRRVSLPRLQDIADSPEQFQRILGQLSAHNRRLVVANDKTVEVAHEVLLSGWERLQNWIKEDRENTQFSRELEAKAEEWKTNYDKQEDALLTGLPLAKYEVWRQTNSSYWISSLSEEYLKKSVEKRDRAKKRKFQLTVGIISGFALAAISLTWIQIRSLQDQAKSSIEGQIKAQITLAETLYKKNDQLPALVESVKALKILDENRTAIDSSLYLSQLQPIIYGVRERNRLVGGHKSLVYSASFSPDGKMIATSGDDNNIRLWTTQGVPIREPLKGHEDRVRYVRFSPNGKIIASASFDGKTILWSANHNGIWKAIFKFTNHQNQKAVYDVRFRPNSGDMASSSEDKTIRIWNKDDKKNIVLQDKDTVMKNEYSIYSIDFHPNGRILASSGYLDGKVNLWDLANGNNSQPEHLGKSKEEKHSELVWVVKFSPRGDILASASQDGTVRLWKVQDKKLIGIIKVEDPSSRILGVAFNSTQSTFATSGEGEKIKLWDINKAISLWKSSNKDLSEPIIELKGHTKTINRVSFHPKDDSILLSSSDDNTIRFWDVGLNRFNPSKENLELDSFIQYGCISLYDYTQGNQAGKSNLEVIKQLCTKYSNKL